MKKPLVLIGAGEYGQIAYDYFSGGQDHEVVAFAVERDFLREPSLFGLPVVPLDELAVRFPPAGCDAHVAVTYTQLNRVRARLYAHARSLGFRMANFISPHAFVGSGVTFGDNVFVFENNVIQHHCTIGNDVVLWSGNHIGHRSVVEDHCYISSHVVVSGYCRVGSHSFLGVNTSVADGVAISRDCFIGAGSVITRDTEPGKIYRPAPAEPAKVGALRFFGIKE